MRVAGSLIRDNQHVDALEAVQRFQKAVRERRCETPDRVNAGCSAIRIEKSAPIYGMLRSFQYVHLGVL